MKDCQVSEKPSAALMYHRIGSPLVRSIVRGQYVTSGLLRSQMGKLRSQRYRCMPLSEVISYGFKANCIAVTFDDGYAAVWRHAYPILAEMGISATVYVVAGSVGGTNEWDERLGDRTEPVLSANEIRELAAAGWEIGSHTMTHAHLPTLSDSELKAELEDSRKALEDIIGGPVTGFSYPYGECDERVKEAVAQTGYSYAAGTNWGALTPSVDRFLIPRTNVRWNNLPPLLMRKICRLR